VQVATSPNEWSSGPLLWMGRVRYHSS